MLSQQSRSTSWLRLSVLLGAFAAIAAAVFLVACGGGGSDTAQRTAQSSDTPTVTAQSAGRAAATSTVPPGWVGRVPPAFTLSTTTLVQTLAPGETKTASVTLTASASTPTATMTIAAPISPYVHVTPTSIDPLVPGQSVSVTLTFTSPLDALPLTATGTVQLRDGSGKALASPIQIGINVVWEQIQLSGSGVSIAPPPTWNVTQNAKSVVISNVPDPSLMTETRFLSDSYFEATLRQNDNPLGLTADQWFTQTLRPVLQDVLRSVSYPTISGYPAVDVTISAIGGKHRHIYVLRGFDVIELTYGLYAPQFVPTYSAIVASLRLTQ